MLAVSSRQWQQAAEAAKEKVLTTGEACSPVSAKTSFERPASRLLKKSQSTPGAPTAAIADAPGTSGARPVLTLLPHGQPPPQGQTAIVQRPFATRAADGYAIRGFFWRHPGEGRAARPVVIINPATSVRCRYYFRFADFLFNNGFDVIAYDYRGIGESRPESLRGFDAGWLDWGRLDFEAVLR